MFCSVPGKTGKISGKTQWPLLLLLLLLLLVVIVVIAVVVVADYYSVTRPVFCKMMSRRVRLPDRTRSHFLSRTSRGMFLHPRGLSCQVLPGLH